MDVEHTSEYLRRDEGNFQNVGTSERFLSALGGGALVGWGLARLTGSQLLALLVGGSLLYRGVKGHCAMYDALGINTATSRRYGVPSKKGVKVEQSIVIHERPEILYRRWRDLPRLAELLPYLKSITVLDDRRSRWSAQNQNGYTVEWEAELINDRPNELIAWQSLPGSQIDTAGSIHFVDLGDDRGTEVRVSMKYQPPLGKIGAHIADLFGVGLDSQLQEALRRFKQRIESGEVPISSSQMQPR
jgi:uncharacterized membrane protein